MVKYRFVPKLIQKNRYFKKKNSKSFMIISFNLKIQLNHPEDK